MVTDQRQGTQLVLATSDQVVWTLQLSCKAQSLKSATKKCVPLLALSRVQSAVRKGKQCIALSHFF